MKLCVSCGKVLYSWESICAVMEGSLDIEGGFQKDDDDVAYFCMPCANAHVYSKWTEEIWQNQGL